MENNKLLQLFPQLKEAQKKYIEQQEAKKEAFKKLMERMAELKKQFKEKKVENNNDNNLT